MSSMPGSNQPRVTAGSTQMDHNLKKNLVNTVWEQLESESAVWINKTRMRIKKERKNSAKGIGLPGEN